jgi:hypothetical protein
MLRWLVAAALVPTSSAWVTSFLPGSLAGRATCFSRGEALWAGGGFGKKECEPEASPKLHVALAS